MRLSDQNNPSKRPIFRPFLQKTQRQNTLTITISTLCIFAFCILGMKMGQGWLILPEENHSSRFFHATYSHSNALHSCIMPQPWTLHWTPRDFIFFELFGYNFAKIFVPLHPKSTKFFANMNRKINLHYYISAAYIYIPYHHNISTNWEGWVLM